MIKLLLCSVLILFSVIGNAYEIKAEFENKSAQTEIVEGQAFDAYIRIWPLLNEDLDLMKKTIEEKQFLDFFYIAKVYEIKYSENNEEVVEIYVKAILKQYYVPRQFYIWPYKSLTIPFEIINVNPQKSELGKDFVISEQSYEELDREKILENIHFYILGLVFLSLVIVIFVRLYKKHLVNKKIKEQREGWNILFKKASERSDFEEIYKCKDEWVSFLGGETPPILHFLTTLNAIQFKKEWTEFEELQVRDSYDEIRGMFERN